MNEAIKHHWLAVTDVDIHPAVPDYDNVTCLEVLVHILHRDGGRQSPMLNRIRIPLQVDDLAL